MKAQNLNNSSKKTRKLIKKVFAEMLSEKRELGKISVSELCARAEISRGTFYSHYDDIYGVAEDYENEIMGLFFSDSMLGEDSWEKAESLLQKRAVELALIKAGKRAEDIDCIFAGDLLNQCIASSFGLREMSIPFVGVYGACSTMALSLIKASMYAESVEGSITAAVTSSHFCSAERQYRYPLEYGGVRPPTSQWTVTGAGAAIVGRGEKSPKITACTIGKIVDMGITDQNNMGAAMAPRDVKIRPYPRHEGMAFFYTQIQYLSEVICRRRSDVVIKIFYYSGV